MLFYVLRVSTWLYSVSMSADWVRSWLIGPDLKCKWMETEAWRHEAVVRYRLDDEVDSHLSAVAVSICYCGSILAY